MTFDAPYLVPGSSLRSASLVFCLFFFVMISSIVGGGVGGGACDGEQKKQQQIKVWVLIFHLMIVSPQLGWVLQTNRNQGTYCGCCRSAS